MSETVKYDVVVIGGGPGGQTLALRGAKVGLKVALVEEKYIGGTCLNEGCIPTKTFVSSVKLYEKIQKASRFGVGVDKPSINWSEILSRKNQIVSSQRKAVAKSLENSGVVLFTPLRAKIISAHEVEVFSIETKEKKILTTFSIVIATGSKNKDILGVDHKGILNSTSILDIDSIPSSLAIIGGGVIGIEFASIFATLGTRVTVLEQMSRILPLEDEELSRDLAKLLTRKKIKFELGVKVNSLRYKNEVDSSPVIVSYSDKSIEVDRVLISVGRAPNSRDIWDSSVGIEVDERGFIKVDSNYQTSKENIYAIGDVINTVSLAHVASMEARFVLDHILGKKPSKINYTHVPSCVYSSPELASVGETEESLKKKEVLYKTVKYPLSSCIKSTIEGERDGYIKIIYTPETHQVLGIHILGTGATEMISDASVSISSGMNLESLSWCIRPHPTVGEALGEALEMGAN